MCDHMQTLDGHVLVAVSAVSSVFKRGDASFSEEEPCAPKPLADAAWPGSGEPAAPIGKRLHTWPSATSMMLAAVAATGLLPPPLSAAVTGANRGLGLALADQLAAVGVNVLLTTRSGGETCRAAEAQLLQRGRRCVEAYDAPLDVSDPCSRAAFIDYCDRRGGIDILINNAAVCSEGWSMDVVRQTLRTNVLGPLALVHALLPGMLRRRCGYVINISS